jgi:predicted small metal-binding protein
MKKFRCGDLMPGCAVTFTGSEDEILAAVGAHAHRDHGITQVTPELVDAVRGSLVSVA